MAESISNLNGQLQPSFHDGLQLFVLAVFIQGNVSQLPQVPHVDVELLPARYDYLDIRHRNPPLAPAPQTFAGDS